MERLVNKQSSQNYILPTNQIKQKFNMGQALAHPTAFDRNEVAEVLDPCGCIDKDVAICISICVRIFNIQDL